VWSIIYASHAVIKENLHYKGVDCPLDCLQWDRGIEDVWHCFSCCDAKNVWEESGLRLLIDTTLAGGDGAATIVFNLLCNNLDYSTPLL
jgi:hypothetical protein